MNVTALFSTLLSAGSIVEIAGHKPIAIPEKMSVKEAIMFACRNVKDWFFPIDPEKIEDKFQELFYNRIIDPIGVEYRRPKAAEGKLWLYVCHTLYR